MTTAAPTSPYSSAFLPVPPASTPRPSLFLPLQSNPTVPLLKGRKRALEYTPGAQVAAGNSAGMEEAQRKRMRSRRNKANKSWFLNLPAETEDKILAILAADRSARYSILRLSMVNRGWRETIQNNLQIWHALYRHWRGPIVASDSIPAAMQTAGMSQRRMVRLNPTTPRTLPNFRQKPPSIS